MALENKKTLDNELTGVKIWFEATPLGLDVAEAPNRELYQLAIYWLAKVYMRTDWAKIARSRNVFRDDVFEHRVKAALSQPNMRRINDKLCEMLGLQSIAISSNVLDELERNKGTLLRAMRREVIYFTLKATELAATMFKNKTWVRI